jgi:acetylornithine deacetylase
VALNELERTVCEAIGRGRDELVALASTLVGFDTTARNPGDPAREEVALQQHLESVMRAAGAETDLFEPDPGELAGMPLVPPGLDFAGRPQLIATMHGAGGGRSLVLNGHIDVVSVQPRDAWASDPFTAQVRDGRLYGRGTCDMKGGIATMVFAAQTLAELGVRLRGDLIVATNTDEESSGAGGTALVQRGLRADAGIVTEATGFDVWVCCRGSEYGVVRVPGRAGHAEVWQPDWSQGGAVNAIEKSAVVLEAIAALRHEWREREGLDHRYLSRPDLLPTMASAGEWPVTYPSSCDLTIAVLYHSRQADATGWGSEVRAEVEQWLAQFTARDGWLEQHPPTIDWWPNGVMPLEIDPSEPIVETMSAASADVGHPGKLSGLDSWYDGATLTTLAGIPAIGFGPPGFDTQGLSVAHTIDEHVPVDGLVACSQAIAVAAMRFCGVA